MQELDKQVPLMDEIEDKVDKVTSDIRNTNMKLRQTLLKVVIFIIGLQIS